MENQVTKTESKFDFPTETIQLPSKGLLYPEDNILSKGTIEMKYMTAVHEDILTNRAYIDKGTVVEKLLQALIVTPINYNDLVVGDQDAVMIAARILGYGKNFSFIYGGENTTVDLSLIEDKPFDKDIITPHVNEFKFTLPKTGTNITFKILTHGDEKKITAELEGLKKIKKDITPILSTRLKYIITSVEGDYSQKTIREFVDSPRFLAPDSRALREYIRKIQPGLDLTFFPFGNDKAVDLPIDFSFFYPDSEQY